ncbi:protein N-terminal glutamine amidohydrolase [Phyllopteryx taeniolatus]|uniref:protein N-terminal glutamine amidohydrolase n=1 Tax=Phyllopteryx taeniolatus TaxID=161469 RepID=UPI002AD2D9AA|nr:protein N-terminal glutamine amidohydrolase [Phyllopteryx taeniolatus]XP_061615975.1 protein N-terminal glutamine amidohydrolase [Phyllopteryx taeniolatus]
MTEDRITPRQDECDYTSCYCEENVWKLCEFVRRERSAPLQELFVAFISNDNRTVPLWKQKSARGDQPVIWDYHVVLLHVRGQGEAAVYDLDSVMPFPCSLKLYAAHALRTDHSVEPTYHRKLRVVPADCFLLNFASDRSHMKNSDSSWRMHPPPYPPISTPESRMNLDDFISMEPTLGWGQVFTLDHFLQRYVKHSLS